jgi:putative hemolysin
LDPDPYPSSLLSIPFQVMLQLEPATLGYVAILVLLLIFSAFISASEIAFFSLSPESKEALREQNTSAGEIVLNLIQRPKHLLATILISNNFVNIGVVIISTFITTALIGDQLEAWAEFLVNVVGITFLLLLFGEVLPKVYAQKNSLSFALFMALPVLFLTKLFKPISEVLIGSSKFIESRLKNSESGISVEDLSTALEITHVAGEEISNERKILKGIVNFGNTEAKQIMKPRVDMVMLEYSADFKEVLDRVLKNGYSRMPVYDENPDHIKGLLYIKDLLPHLEKDSDFPWQTLLRPAFFIPENKKLDDLLKEFQHRKVHIAIVVDEYGGSSGLVTMEDILEEIVGEISDEFDDEDLVYSKIDDQNFVFEGKILLRDMYRVLNIEGEEFEKRKGEADTLAGFILEQSGKIPQKGQVISFSKYALTVEGVDKRRITRIKVTLTADE